MLNCVINSYKFTERGYKNTEVLKENEESVNEVFNLRYIFCNILNVCFNIYSNKELCFFFYFYICYIHIFKSKKSYPQKTKNSFSKLKHLSLHQFKLIATKEQAEKIRKLWNDVMFGIENVWLLFFSVCNENVWDDDMICSKKNKKAWNSSNICITPRRMYEFYMF